MNAFFHGGCQYFWNQIKETGKETVIIEFKHSLVGAIFFFLGFDDKLDQ